MITINFKDYTNRVHGCWLGRCLGSTLGRAYPLSHQCQSIAYDPAIHHHMRSNPAMDAQLSCLNVLKRTGPDFSPEELSQSFDNKIPNPNCPGSLFRSELWACLAAGDPERALYLSARDALPGRSAAALQAGQFLSAVQAAAFVIPDLDECIDTALAEMPAAADLRCLVEMLRTWATSSRDWQSVREKIAGHYGAPEAGEALPHLGFAFLALHYGQYDFINTLLIALNCGFDASSTCAAAGAILGVHCGATGLMNNYGFLQQHYWTDSEEEAPAGHIGILAEEIAHIGQVFQAGSKTVQFACAPQPLSFPPAAPEMS